MHTEVTIQRWEGSVTQTAIDSLAVEEPLEIRINGESLVVTMRTPGDDFALAAGFLLTEGIIRDGEEIASMAYCAVPENPELHNIVNVYLGRDWKERVEASRLQRHFTATSSCGLCGKSSIEAIRIMAEPLNESNFRTPASVIQALPDKMRAAQKTFARTGGLHAAGLFDQQGELLSLCEDVGRHNALDKLIGGEILAERMPLSQRILLVSGRTSFEIIQKAAVARIPLVCAVSAPSSLAVQLALEMNMTLIGFLRGVTMNVYSCPERVGEDERQDGQGLT